MYKTKVILFHVGLLEILRREWGESVSTHGFFFFFFQFQSYECKLVKQSLKNKLKIMFEAGVFYYLVDFDDAHLITKLLAETFTGPVTTQAGIPG